MRYKYPMMQSGPTSAASPQMDLHNVQDRTVQKQKEQQSAPRSTSNIRIRHISSAAPSTLNRTCSDPKSYAQHSSQTSSSQTWSSSSFASSTFSSARHRQPHAHGFHSQSTLESFDPDTATPQRSYATKPPSSSLVKFSQSPASSSTSIRSSSSRPPQAKPPRPQVSSQTHFPYHSVRNQVYDRFHPTPLDKVRQQKQLQLQNMPLFLPLSLGGTAADDKQREKEKRLSRAKSQPLSRHNLSQNPAPATIHVRKHKVHTGESCRSGVDPHDLSRRLYSVLAQRGELPPCGVGNVALPAESKRMPTSKPEPAPSAAPAATSKPAGPYVPCQAATQFTRTTATMGVPRKTIRLKPRMSNMALSGPSEEHKEQQPLQKRSSVSPSTSLRHAYKDTQSTPGCRRPSMKDGDESTQEPSDNAEKAETKSDSTDGSDPDPEEDNELAATSTTKGLSKATPPAEYMRIAQERSVDWTQSDEMRQQRETAEKEKEEAEREAEKKGNRLHRLRARLSTFSRERLSDYKSPATSPPASPSRIAAIPEERYVVPMDGVLNGRRSGRADEEVPALASPTASSPPSTTELSLTTSATLAQPLGQTHTQAHSKLSRNRSSDRFLSMFKN
ncbi:hypothetical protein F503_02382 [Ophiostoma piceae UAMH 11346]|uniref:Uncharacterized protein n=1 Tax=Ophiostoma piceae (strain UAMH 11346) TaxID=1262450 RepID=S3BYF2_OPHP1|nr:hypothetical protein F503_02382 [Ophiostoma piceae UAMH 11346]